MEETMMNTTNEVIEEATDAIGGFSGKKIVIGVAIVAGLAAAGYAGTKLAKKAIAKIKAKRKEAKADVIDAEYSDVSDSENED